MKKKIKIKKQKQYQIQKSPECLPSPIKSNSSATFNHAFSITSFSFCRFYRKDKESFSPFQEGSHPLP